MEYKLFEPPKYAGGYSIGGSMGLQINFEKKPMWIHRKMMLWCLGWEWVDANL